MGPLSGQKETAEFSAVEELGKRLFFDRNLSTPPGQECAVCHGPSVGFTGPDAQINVAHGVYEGAVKGRFGNRKPPASAYAGGSHKTPTLRNVDRRPSPGFVKAFMHNGYFKSLKDVVHFYNTRDKAGANWPPPEVAANVNRAEMGDLGLTDDEENAIVEFMKTLSDRR